MAASFSVLDSHIPVWQKRRQWASGACLLLALSLILHHSGKEWAVKGSQQHMGRRLPTLAFLLLVSGSWYCESMPFMRPEEERNEWRGCPSQQRATQEKVGAFPPPALLPQRIWKQILPRSGFLLLWLDSPREQAGALWMSSLSPGQSNRQELSLVACPLVFSPCPSTQWA